MAALDSFLECNNEYLRIWIKICPPAADNYIFARWLIEG